MSIPTIFSLERLTNILIVLSSKTSAWINSIFSKSSNSPKVLKVLGGSNENAPRIVWVLPLNFEIKNFFRVRVDYI